MRQSTNTLTVLFLLSAQSFRTIKALLIALTVAGCATLGFAQGIVTGSISGTVEDPQGAVVQGAKVTATHLATNRQFTTQSNSAGTISLRSLPTGAYNVRVDSPGFRRFESAGVKVAAGDDTALGVIQLTVGSSTETVMVEGTAPIIEATTDQISETFDSKKVASLPVGNTYDSLALFIPGVATAGDSSFSNNNGAELSVNGERARANNFQIDGQSNNDNSIAGPSIFFGNQDAISEVQVVTNYDAEFGRNSGAVVNYLTKAGTNNFHGTAYEFWQGSTFDSLENQEKNPILGFCTPGQDPTTTGCIKPVVPRYVDNRFGGTLGGPVKKDKIWFFGSANFERQRTGGAPSSSAPGLVPTPTGVQQLEAAFPSSPIGLIESTIGPNAVKAGNPVFNNIQNVLVTNQLMMTTNGLAATPCTMAGQNGCVPIQFGSITRFVPSPFNDYEGTGRMDFKLSSKDNLFARYVVQKQSLGGVNFGNGIDVGDWQNNPSLSQQIGLDWVRNFSNTTVNQVRASYSRSNVFFQEASFPTCVSATPTACPADMIMLGSAFQDTVSFGVAPGNPSGRIINVYQLQDNASKLIGRHTIKFGGETDQQRSPNLFLPYNNGAFFFNSFSDVIANNPVETQIALGNPRLPFKEWDVGTYVQDDWRIKDNLTLNLGMRWDWYQQAINLLHDKSVRQQTGPDPLWSTALPLSQTTVPSVPQELHNFAPVVGFAWTPRMWNKVTGQDKTVIRGGFRLAYDPAFYNMFLNVGNSAPSVNFSTLFGTGLPSAGFFGTQVIPFLQPQAPKIDPGIANQTQVSNDFRNPYAEQWNLGIQRTIVNNKVVAEVRYVGNHAVAQFQSLNTNPALGPLIAAGFANLIPAGLKPCTTAGAPGAANGIGYANCNFTNVTQFTNTAWSKYDGLQSELRIAGWHGLSATASYTYSHSIDNVSEVYGSLAPGASSYGGNTLPQAQNPFNTDRAERGNSGTDFPHVFGLAMVYDLPFYKKQQGWLGHLLGGWQFNSTYRFTSGQPYTVVQKYVTGSLCDPTSDWGGSYDACRPILSNAALPLSSVGQYCDGTAATCLGPNGTTPLPLGTLVALGDPCLGSGAPGGTPCAVTPISGAHWILNDPTAAKVLGTPFAGVGRNTLRGEPISTANVAFFKNTKVTEKLTLQFQAQAFNIMNTMFRGVPDPILQDAAIGKFESVQYNLSAGGTFAGNVITDGIGRRRLLFGLKLIF
jgi:Carboxypeptidase regulatory-like domain/TonB dependent receptor/TonB-dependent Receptor Plug Domain